MSHRIAYYRVSTGDQSIEAQRSAMGGSFDQEHKDEGVSGATLAADRPGFAKLLETVRRGDTVCVYAVDRLGRDALDVQGTVRTLIDKGVVVDVHGLGPITGDIGKLILAVLSQVAEMERNRIRERCNAGRDAARTAIAATGMTHKGKHGLGRKPLNVGPEIAAWRKANGASIAQTAEHFKVSPASVKRYCVTTARNEALGENVR
jgi:putative DNA-invertase from lambdoid prophage Rac